ncbi:MAG: CoA ester lyase [Rhodobacterales bacterium 32-66-9]|jgi:citrate lyase subunit beta/citryl-CoA lyase|nr:MAG: CoA ester lyase [Rhodobacterales bacterium 32-66-9]
MALSALRFVAPLFVPANRPERFAKAAASGADAIILDLEDAVAPVDKDAARAALSAGFTDLPVIVRINAAGTAWHAADLAAAAQSPFAAIMLPKAASLDDIMRVAAIRPVVALIETAAGIAEARTIARSGHVARLAFGSVDYAADLGCDHVPEALAAARAEIVLASRLGELPAPLDGVTTDLSDPAIAESDARGARALGFGGKLAIHPRQIEPIKSGFQPRPSEIEWARQVLDSGDGAVRIGQSMIDEPVRARARALLARVSQP